MQPTPLIWNDKVYFVTKFKDEELFQIKDNYKEKPLTAKIDFNQSFLQISFLDMDFSFREFKININSDIEYVQYLIKDEDIFNVFILEEKNSKLKYLFKKQLKII